MKKILLNLMMLTTVPCLAMVTLPKLKERYQKLIENPLENEHEMYAIFEQAKEFGVSGKTWVNEQRGVLGAKLDDLRQRKNRRGSTVRTPNVPEPEQKKQQAIIDQLSVIKKMWETLQPLMKKYSDAVLYPNENIWNRWSAADWDAIQNPTPILAWDEAGKPQGRAMQFPAFGRFLDQYMRAYTDIDDPNRPFLVQYAGSVAPTLFGFENKSREQLQELLEDRNSFLKFKTPSLAKIVEDHIKKMPPQAPKPQEKEGEIKADLEKKMRQGAVFVSRIFPSFTQFKQACAALPLLADGAIVEQGNKAQGLDFAEFDRVLTQFFATIGSGPMNNVRNWINKKTNFETKTVPMMQEFSGSEKPAADFFNPTIKTERQSYVQKITVPAGTVALLHGDLHGDVHSLVESLAPYMDGKNGFALKGDHYVFFLGDYVDRGLYGFECLYTMMRLKIDNPERVFMCRGNHEDISISNAYGFATELAAKGISNDQKDKIYRLYDLLPVGVYLGCENDYVLLCHGGLELGFLANNLLNAQGSYQWINLLDRKRVFDLLSEPVKKTLEPYVGTEIVDNIIPVPGNTGAGIVKGALEDTMLGFCWSDFVVDQNLPSSWSWGRGLQINRALAFDLFKLQRQETKQLVGVMRAHQHSPQWNDMMTLILDRNNEDPSNKGVAKLWSAAKKKGDTLWKNIVVTLNVSPDMAYGLPNPPRNWPGFDFDTTCLLTIEKRIEKWMLKVIRTKITTLRPIT